MRSINDSRNNRRPSKSPKPKQKRRPRFVRDIMNTRIHFVRVEQTALAAAEMMANENIGAVIVRDANSQVVGIFTERDLLKRVTARKLDAAKVEVGSVMTSAIITVQPTHELADLAQVMVDGNFRHLPVFEDNELSGMISIRDLLVYLARGYGEELAA